MRLFPGGNSAAIIIAADVAQPRSRRQIPVFGSEREKIARSANENVSLQISFS
jgi:hypothetical protein